MSKYPLGSTFLDSARGTAFRVWAPNASSVSVTGTFNSWSDTANSLTKDGDHWSGVISNANVGDEYEYVIVNRDDGKKHHRIDPYARDVTSSDPRGGKAIIVNPQFNWGSDSYQTPAWNKMVIYELHIGTFNDQPGGKPGKIIDAINKLDYLKDLGINVIQIMPFAEFRHKWSWGYNPSNIFAVESAYGGPHEFKQLVKEAHARGIAVICDVVYNHFGPRDLDLWQFDGWSKNNKGGIYFYNDWRSETPWGNTRPDYGRSEVRKYIRDNALMWLEEYQADGLRWDSTVNIRTKWNGGGGKIDWGWPLMQQINDEINAKSPWKINIAEDLQNNEWITKNTEVGGAGFDAQWDPGFIHPIHHAIIPPSDNQRNMYEVRDAIYHRYNRDAFERVIYTESHDEVGYLNGKVRVPEAIWPTNADSWYSRKRSTLGAALVFTAPGIPMIFQGQEFLEYGSWHDDDPIDWNHLNKYSGIHNMYRDLIRLRRNWYNKTRGLSGQHVNVHHVNNSNKLIAFHRWANGGKGDDVIVVANMAKRSYKSYNIGFPREGSWKVRFNSDWDGYSSDFNNHHSYNTTASRGTKDKMPFNGNVGIGPYSVIILSQ